MLIQYSLKEDVIITVHDKFKEDWWVLVVLQEGKKYEKAILAAASSIILMIMHTHILAVRIVFNIRFSETLRINHWRSFTKKLFSKISQIWQENICDGVSFLLNLQASASSLKKHTDTGIFPWILRNFYQNSFLQNIFLYFFSIWVFFYVHSQIIGPQGKGDGISLTPHYHFHSLQRHLDISRAITAERSPGPLSYRNQSEQINGLCNRDLRHERVLQRRI